MGEKKLANFRLTRQFISGMQHIKDRKNGREIVHVLTVEYSPKKIKKKTKMGETFEKTIPGKSFKVYDPDYVMSVHGSILEEV